MKSRLQRTNCGGVGAKHPHVHHLVKRAGVRAVSHAYRADTFCPACWGGPPPPSECRNWNELTRGADLYKQEPCVIRVWKNFFFAISHQRSSSVSSRQTSASPVLIWNEQTDVHRTSCSCSNQERRMQPRPNGTFSGPAVNRLQGAASRQAQGLQTVTGGRQSPLREKHVDFPSSFISSHLLPLTWPPHPPTPLVNQYAQTERFLPSSPSRHPMVFEKVKRTQPKGENTFCVRNTDSVLRNLEVWVPFLLMFGF